MQNAANEVRVTAKTLEQAIKEASTVLETSQDNVDYRVISQTNGGFFSFLGKKVEIAAWAKSASLKKPSRRTGGTRADDDRQNSRLSTKKAAVSAEATETVALSDEEVSSLVDDLRSFCEGICRRISGESVKVHAELDGDRLVLDIDNDYLSVQIVKNAKLAESLEHILRKKPRHLKRELPFRIFVDVKGVRRKREDDLVELARDLSEKVNENKRPIVLNYKSSYDRKIIHMALDKDERVYTKSIGSGPNRKLMILPIKKKEIEELSHESQL